MDRFDVGGREVLVWSSAFSPEECALLAERVPWPPANPRGHQGFVEASVFARELGYLCAGRMPGAPALDWLEDLTVTVDQRIGWHVDPARGATRKLRLYLDDAGPNAGTSFVPGDLGGAALAASRGMARTVGGAQGSIVLFDIALVHRAADERARGRRRVLGLRARVVA